VRRFETHVSCSCDELAVSSNLRVTRGTKSTAVPGHIKTVDILVLFFFPLASTVLIGPWPP
jgi:hypothetical protein